MIGVRIDPHLAKARLDAGEAATLDVTSALVWPAVNHSIPGSVRILPEPILRALDQARPASEILSLFAALPEGKEIIAYCTCPNEETSARIAQFLRNHGRQAWALRGGLAAWRIAGYPMESKAASAPPSADAECPDCEEEVAAHQA
jgi:rhodanese-related sulfurtransferase